MAKKKTKARTAMEKAMELHKERLKDAKKKKGK